MNYAKNLLFRLVIWLILCNLRIVRWLGSGEIGQVVFRDKLIILFPRSGRQGYVLNGKVAEK